MLHAWPHPPVQGARGTYLSHSRAHAFPGSVVQDRPCSVHAGAAVCGGLCIVKVKLTIALARSGNLLVSRAFDPSRISGEGVTRASNRLVVARGGVGIFLRGPRGERPTVTEREGFLRALPFL